MNRYEGLMIAQAPALLSWSGLKEELDALKQCIEAMLNDVRSSIVRECCRLLVSLAGSYGAAGFEESITLYIPILCSRLYVTIKVISSSCDTCIRELVTRAHTAAAPHKVLAPLFAGTT